MATCEVVDLLFEQDLLRCGASADNDRPKFIISMPLVCWRRRGEISLKDERKYE
jgi:hypothetical protein